jgi:DNA invertase Pin-like site-specific DNA recombinase
VFKKMLLGGVALIFVAGSDLAISPSRAYANKVDCSKVMSEVNAGKKASAIAKDLSISTSSVYRCKQKAGATKTTSSKSGAKTVSTASPAASPANH